MTSHMRDLKTAENGFLPARNDFFSVTLFLAPFLLSYRDLTCYSFLVCSHIHYASLKNVEILYILLVAQHSNCSLFLAVCKFGKGDISIIFFLQRVSRSRM